MAAVSIVDIKLKNENTSKFFVPFMFEIMFECNQELEEDLEWRLTYVGSAESTNYDQVLSSILVGPVVLGYNSFVFEVDPPDPSKIPEKDAIGVTALLLSCLYKEQEFVRVGYYVNVSYESEELNQNPPSKPDFSKMVKHVLSNIPRVTRFDVTCWPVVVNPIDEMDQEDVPKFQAKETSLNAFSNLENKKNELDFTKVFSEKLSLYIFSLFDFSTLASLLVISKRWKKIIEKGVGWKDINLSYFTWNFHESEKKSACIYY